MTVESHERQCQNVRKPHVCFVGADRSHWLRRDENMICRDEWAKVLLDDFKREIAAAHEMILSNNNSPNHATSFRPSSPTVHVLVRPSAMSLRAVDICELVVGVYRHIQHK